MSEVRINHGGSYKKLADAIAVNAGGNVDSGEITAFGKVSVFVAVNAATTVTVFLRSAFGNYYTAATWTATAASSNLIPINTPGKGIQVVSSAVLTNWTVEYLTD